MLGQICYSLHKTEELVSSCFGSVECFSYNIEQIGVLWYGTHNDCVVVAYL